jgi:hypothetical protein
MRRRLRVKMVMMMRGVCDDYDGDDGSLANDSQGDQTKNFRVF